MSVCLNSSEWLGRSDMIEVCSQSPKDSKKSKATEMLQIVNLLSSVNEPQFCLFAGVVWS